MTGMNILVAEDEPKMGAFLQQGLSEAGFNVERVSRGDHALLQVQSKHYHLLILDVMMPGADGWQVLQQLRATGQHLPVLFLTARDGVADRVKGLELGADDYLIKPFAFSELLARVRSLLRRGQPPLNPASTRLQMADLELDLLSRRIYRAGQRIELTAKEFALLELFLRHPGEVLSKALIAAQVWDMHFDSYTNVIEVAVRRLRGKIDDAFESKLIHTVRGLGYKMEEPT